MNLEPVCSPRYHDIVAVRKNVQELATASAVLFFMQKNVLLLLLLLVVVAPYTSMFFIHTYTIFF